MDSSSTSPRPECYLITYNVSSKSNIGTLLRCATAFDVKEVCVVGSRDFSTFGCHGADAYVKLRHYNTLEECCTDLKTNHGCEIIGIEIVDSAKPVNTHPFSGPVAFMLGNEGAGMNEKQMKLCDSFVYIPQYGPGTASLNVAVAASIVLHNYALWAGYKERERQGYKFVLGEKDHMRRPRGRVPFTEEEKEALREARKVAAGGGDDGEQVYSVEFD